MPYYSAGCDADCWCYRLVVSNGEMIFRDFYRDPNCKLHDAEQHTLECLLDPSCDPDAELEEEHDSPDDELCPSIRPVSGVSLLRPIASGLRSSRSPSPITALDVLADCTCQAQQAAAQGVPGVCPNAEDSLRIECAVMPYGPDDGPKPECAELAKRDAAANVQQLCGDIDCPDASRPVVSTNGGQHCICLKDQVATDAMTKGCFALDCRDGFCACNDGVCACRPNSADAVFPPRKGPLPPSPYGDIAFSISLP